MSMMSKTKMRRYHLLSIIIFLVLCSPSNGIGIEFISIDENTPTYIRLSWGIEAGSSWDYYLLEIVPSSGNSLNGYPINITDISHLITGLRPVEEYTINVTPWKSEGGGDSLNTTILTAAIAKGEILASDVTSSSAFIQWRNYETVFVYTVLYESSDVSQSLQGIFEPEVELRLPRPGTVFNVTVQGSNMDLASTQIRTAPEGPENVSLAQIGSNEATLSWTPPGTPHDAYEFYVTNNNTNERSLLTTLRIDDVSDYQVTLSGLLPATIYSFEVGTVLNATDSLTLQRSGQTNNPRVIGRTAPEGPEDVSLAQIGSNEATLSWTPPGTPHDAYEFYVTNNNTNERSLLTTLRIDDVSDYQVTLSGLLPATIYSFEVGTVLNATDSLTLQRSGQTNNPRVIGRTAPEAAVNISLHRIGTTEVTLSWTPPSSQHDVYEFYVINNSTHEHDERSLVAAIQREDISDYEITLPGLSRDTQHRFEVGTVLNASDYFELQRSYQNDNPSVFGRTEAIAEGEILLSVVTSTSAYIQWKPKEGVSSYTIVAEPNDTIESLGNISDSEVGLTILLPGTVFTVTVRGGNPARDLASTQIRSGPEPPLSIMVTSIGSDFVKVTFTPPTSNHDAYELYVSNSTTDRKSLITTVQREYDMSYEKTMVGLSCSTYYYVEVGTILNAEGSFSLQRSEDNPMTMFQTGDAVSDTLQQVMFLIPLLVVFIM